MAPSRRAFGVRTLGVLLSGIAAVALLAVALVSTLRPDPQQTDGPPPGLPTLAEGAAGMRVQLVDRDDPNTLIGTLTTDRVDPDGESYTIATSPVATIFGDDGSRWTISADRGRFFIPPGEQRPRSGTLRGGVRVELARADAPPDLVATTSEPLFFDLDVLSFESEGDVAITGAGIEFAGRGVSAVLSETSRRINRLIVREGRRLTLTPAGNESSASDPATEDAQRSGEPTLPTYYSASVEGDVSLVQGDVALSAGRLDLWATLISGRPALGSAPNRDANDGPPDENATTAGEPVFSPDDPLTLAWTGRLELEPSDPRPAQLADDPLVARFTAPAGLVRIRDDGADATAEAGVVTYAGGARTVELSCPAGCVKLASRGDGELRGATLVRIDTVSGLVTVPGPGGLYTAADAAQRERVEWTGEAGFEFDTASTALRTARFSGDVRGVSPEGTADAASMTVRFTPAADGEPRIAAIDLTDAEAADRAGGLLAGRSLRVEFDPAADTLVPIGLSGSGDVLARRGEGGELRAGELDADLAQDDRGRTTLQSIIARRGVSFDDAQGTSGRAETLSANPQLERATLTGADAFVLSDGATITGPSIELDGAARTASVEGPGRFEQLREGEPALTASWSGGMRFDDLGGTLLARGDADILAVEPGVSSDRVTARAVQAALAPFDPDAPDTGVDRRLLSATALGGEEPARVESRRLEGGTLAELFFLQGGRIEFSNADATLDVPTPGRMLVYDATADENAARGEPGTRGRTLFEWTGSMQLDRAAGRAELRSGVRVTHEPLDRESPLYLASEGLTARFRELSGDARRVDRFEGDLTSVVATGNAVVRTEAREILAERIDYDAERGVLVATAPTGGLISIVDLISGTSTTAGRIAWDLASDRLTIDKPGPATGGRP